MATNPEQPRPKRRSLARGWRRSYSSSQSVGMTLGMIAVGVVVFLFFGPLLLVAALVLLGLVWFVRHLGGRKAQTAPTREKAHPRDRRRDAAGADVARDSASSGAAEPPDGGLRSDH